MALKTASLTTLLVSLFLSGFLSGLQVFYAVPALAETQGGSATSSPAASTNASSSGDGAPSPYSLTGKEHEHRGKSTKLIPLPIYATLPNEGSTWGFMPVFLIYDFQTARTTDIIAPSVSWNLIIRYTSTFRWYKYPSDHESIAFIISGSTHVNWGGLITYDNIPLETGALTHQIYFRYGRSIFYRFFGIGPDTVEGDETSHTRLRGDFRYRLGKNIANHWNVGAKIEVARDLVQSIAVPDVPLSTDRFAGTPGMGGASIVSEGLDIRYDTRKNLDYSLDGTFVDLSVAPVQGLASSPNFLSILFEARQLIEETDSLQGGARFLTSWVTSKDVPFYYQSILGGSFLMRGFQEDRFVDQGAWTFELEQRIRLFQTHIYGVTADWRVDPFFSVGQVFDGANGPFSNVKYAGGLGFRAWVRPNVLGRVDAGYGAEGVKFYVELGYPF